VCSFEACYTRSCPSCRTPISFPAPGPATPTPADKPTPPPASTTAAAAPGTGAGLVARIMEIPYWAYARVGSSLLHVRLDKLCLNKN
jgi:hypothetical protein